MKVGLVLLALALIYLVGQLYAVWRSRGDVQKPPPGGWKKPGWDDDDDWPGRP